MKTLNFVSTPALCVFQVLIHSMPPCPRQFAWAMKACAAAHLFRCCVGGESCMTLSPKEWCLDKQLPYHRLFTQ